MEHSASHAGQIGHRCIAHGVVQTASRARPDLPFGQRQPTLQWCVPECAEQLRHALVDESKGLSIRKRKKTKRIGVRVPLVAAMAVNQTWSMDFVSDAIARPCAVSRRIKCLTVADDFSHECVDITADFGIGGAYVTHLLDRAATFRGYPKEVGTDNGPEFTCRAFMTWTQRHGIKHLLIEPASPTQNAYIDSFNGAFRDECLDENWFESLELARQTIVTWRTDYNEIRPHSSCGRMPPATFAALHGHAKHKSKPDAPIS